MRLYFCSPGLMRWSRKKDKEKEKGETTWPKKMGGWTILAALATMESSRSPLFGTGRDLRCPIEEHQMAAYTPGFKGKGIHYIWSLRELWYPSNQLRA